MRMRQRDLDLDIGSSGFDIKVKDNEISFYKEKVAIHFNLKEKHFNFDTAKGLGIEDMQNIIHYCLSIIIFKSLGNDNE